MPPLCEQLKKVGSVLEKNSRGKLDLLQTYFTEMCKDGRIDIATRLNLLVSIHLFCSTSELYFSCSQNIIELRSMGWKSNPQVESFYREKISQFEKYNQRTPSSSSQGQKSFLSSPSSSSRGRFSSFTSSVESLTEEPECRGLGKERLVVNMRGESMELFISSADSELVKDARTVLSQYFASKSVSGGPGVQYSREELLSVARSSSASEIPRGWEGVTAKLPEVVKKVH